MEGGGIALELTGKTIDEVRDEFDRTYTSSLCRKPTFKVSPSFAFYVRTSCY